MRGHELTRPAHEAQPAVCGRIVYGTSCLTWQV